LADLTPAVRADTAGEQAEPELSQRAADAVAEAIDGQVVMIDLVAPS
jgi:hypothetical protein